MARQDRIADDAVARLRARIGQRSQPDQLTI
jgi:hypothetical protein